MRIDVKVGGSVLVCLLLVAGFAFSNLDRKPVNQPPSDFGRAPAFSLTNQDERIVRSTDLAGKVWVVNLIYTHCTDTCPLLTSKMKGIHKRLASDGLLGEDVVLLSFTADPIRDTPRVLREYAKSRSLDLNGWHFLTGPEDEVRRVIVKGFFLGMNPDHSHEDGPHVHSPDDEYLVFHSSRFVLVDREGRIRGYPDGIEVDPEEIVEQLRLLL